MEKIKLAYLLLIKLNRWRVYLETKTGYDSCFSLWLMIHHSSVLKFLTFLKLHLFVELSNVFFSFGIDHFVAPDGVEHLVGVIRSGVQCLEIGCGGVLAHAAEGGDGGNRGGVEDRRIQR